MNTVEKARFDTRLAKEQKDLFEYAAGLGGFRNLTDFVIHAANEKSKQIIAEHNLILASQRDQQIFFDAITGDALPNDALKTAAARYQKALEA
jgi:uncharacterized protein (DUF1778 family)